MTRARDVASQGGLVLISSTAVGTAVSSVTVSNAFSATYDNYKILLSGGTGSVNERIAFQLGASSTGYYGGFIRTDTIGATPTALGDNGASRFSYLAGSDSNGNNGDINLIAPFLTKETWVTAFVKYDANYGTYNGVHAVVASYTDFTLYPATGTLTGGTLKVYGYKN